MMLLAPFYRISVLLHSLSNCTRFKLRWWVAASDDDDGGGGDDEVEILQLKLSFWNERTEGERAKKPFDMKWMCANTKQQIN